MQRKWKKKKRKEKKKDLTARLKIKNMKIIISHKESRKAYKPVTYLQFRFSKGKLESNVGAGLGVVSKSVIRMDVSVHNRKEGLDM